MAKTTAPPPALPARDEPIGPTVNRLAFPIIVENTFQTMLGLVDLAMVSSLGAAAIAGVGTGGQVVWVYISALSAISVGTTVLVARYTGAREPHHANQVVKQSLLLGALVAVALTLGGHFGAEAMLRAMRAEPDVVQLGGVYLRIVSDMAIFLVANFILGAALRGAGDSRTPMLATGLANVVNVIVAYLLIFGNFGFPQLGAAGAGYAAGVGRMVGTSWLLYALLRSRSRVSIADRVGWAPDLDVIRRILRIGIPSMIEGIVFSGGMLGYSVIVFGLGTTVVAAQRIAFQLMSLSFMPGFGYAMAATTLTGQALGARRPDLADRSTRYALLAALAWMTTMGVVFFFFGHVLVGLFTSDPKVIGLGAAALGVLACSQPFQAPAQVYAGSLRGAGDTRFPMVLTSLSMWLVRLPLGWLLGIPLGLGLPGVMASAVIDGAARGIGAYLRYRTGAWRHIKV